MSRPLVTKNRTQQHANGKTVSILRDYSMQADIVRAALRRKRKNDVRNAKVTNDLPIDSVDSDVAGPVLSAEGASERASKTYPGTVTGRISAASPNLQNTPVKLTGEQRTEVERIKRSVRSEHVRQQADASPPRTEGNGGWTDETASAFFGIPGLRMVRENGGAGLCESDGVGRVQEPTLCGDGGDGSLSDQPV